MAIQNSVLHPRRITKIVSIKFPVSKESGIAWTIFDVCIATSNYGCFTISLFATYEHNTGIVKKLFVNKNNIPDAVKNIFCISYGNEGSSPKIWITNTSNEAINWDYCFIIIKNVITTGSSYDGDSFILSLDDSIIGNVSGTTTL